MEEVSSARSRALIFFICFVNVTSSIAIINLNKYIYVHHGFPNITLTCLHFWVTFIGVLLCAAFSIFQKKIISVVNMLPLAATFCGFVVFNNLSLQFNTVGTYQVLKVLTMPTIVVIESIIYGKRYRWLTLSTFVPVLVGTFLNSYYDIKFNLSGIILAVIAVVVTSFYQIWVGRKQKEYEANSLQMLYYQAPLSAVMLVFVIPFFEPVIGEKGLLQHEWSKEAQMAIFASGVVAFLVNLSIYLVIGKLSPLAYNFLGHLKTCLIIASGPMLYNDHLLWEQIIGVVFVIGGCIAYTQIKEKEKPQATQPSAPPKE